MLQGKVLVVMQMQRSIAHNSYSVLDPTRYSTQTPDLHKFLFVQCLKITVDRSYLVRHMISVTVSLCLVQSC